MSMRKNPGWSERQAMRYRTDNAEHNAEFIYLEYRLEAAHPGANNPHEPYSGVAALFNADHHTISPHMTPRENWIIESPEKITLKESCEKWGLDSDD